MSLKLFSQSAYVGIDPGLSGAVVALASDKTILLRAKAPTFKQPVNHTKYDLQSMLNILKGLKELYPNITAGIERSHSRPTDSRRSAWTTGCGFGFWQMALVAADIPYEIIAPKSWQKLFVDEGKDTKALSVQTAKTLLPKLDLIPTPRSRKEDHNISDAGLIALYCMLKTMED